MSDRDIAERLQRMRERGERAEDIMGMISAFYPQSRRLATRHPMVMDLCGTGGAAVRTFNISTTSSFVLAAAGVPVAKHGNRSSCGRCGSADLLESMGADISTSPETSSKMLDRIGFAFLFAPLYHPSMRMVSKARKMVTCRTVFNVMGPLMNPVQARRRQLLGVSSAELLEVVPRVLDFLGVEEAMVVHGRPGMDEVSPCGETLVAHLKSGEVERYEIAPEDLGVRRCPPGDIAELPPQSAARCCYEVLRGRRGARRDAVLVNSACAFLVSGKVSNLQAGMALAELTIDSGKAFAKMREYIRASRGEL
jgi:anthranilate phosphoribosyltransferase